MIPFILALFVSLALSSFVEFQVQRLKVPSPLALPLTLLVAVLLFFLLGALVSASVSQLSANSSTYQAQVRQIMDQATAALPAELVRAIPDSELQRLSEIPLRTVGRMLAATTNAIVEILSQSLIVLIFVIFLLIGGGGNRLPPGGTWGEIETRIKSYLVVKVGISAVTGVLVGLVLSLLGVPLAMVFGLFAFLLNFIPNIGSFIATLLPLPVVMVTPDISLAVAGLAIAIPAVVQLTVGNLLEPKIMGESLDLHPVTILLALIFWGTLWGIVGMLLATPMTAAMKIVFEKLEGTKQIAEIMAGRLDVIRPTVAAVPPV
jgi:AI-2 transport protein TqsA